MLKLKINQFIFYVDLCRYLNKLIFLYALYFYDVHGAFCAAHQLVSTRSLAHLREQDLQLARRQVQQIRSTGERGETAPGQNQLLCVVARAVPTSVSTT